MTIDRTTRAPEYAASTWCPACTSNTAPCPSCGGTGRVTPEDAARIRAEIREARRRYEEEVDYWEGRIFGGY